MSFLGTSTNKRLVKDIFGSPEAFAAELSARKSKSFLYKKAVAVLWDRDTEVYEFYWP